MAKKVTTLLPRFFLPRPVFSSQLDNQTAAFLSYIFHLSRDHSDKYKAFSRCSNPERTLFLIQVSNCESGAQQWQLGCGRELYTSYVRCKGNVIHCVIQTCIASHFTSEKEKAVILDVACGTGLVSRNLKKMGFCRFVGVDGSEKMLSLAKQTGLYQELKNCMLCVDPLPVQDESFDVVVMVGALSIGHVPVEIIRELWKATKPGGYVCMTTRGNADNLEYKAKLENEIQAMEKENKWRCVTVSVVEKWEKAVAENECGYITGVIYLYQKTV